MSAVPPQQPIFQIQRMYLKDLSLEIPGAPRIFLEQQQPAVEMRGYLANVGLGSEHMSVGGVMMADGSVQFLSFNSLTPQVWLSLLSSKNGENVQVSE
jgi:preprotein translocase subunit SecB